MALEGPRVTAASGRARSLVIFLHGYGADGDDLIGISGQWADALPDTEFVAPHAPESCVQNPDGRQWWDLSMRSEAELWAGVQRAGPGLDAFITAEGERLGIPAGRIALVGFSQGTMMALHVGLRRAEPLAGIIGYAGVLAGRAELAAGIRSRPPVFLAHGTADQVVPIDALVGTVEALAENDVPRRWHVAHGLPHGIDPIGLAKGSAFLGEVLKREN